MSTQLPKLGRAKNRKQGPKNQSEDTCDEVERGGRASVKVPKDHRSHQKGEILETGKS
jgi:hypothetical protein